MAAKTQTAERLSDLLAAGGPLDDARALVILRQLTAQVATLHTAGKLGWPIRADRVAVNSDTARLAAADSISETDIDSALLPPEIQSHRLSHLPERIEDARAALRSAGVDLDPRRIDVYQLGCLACEMLTGSSPQTYLFSLRAKARVAVPMRRVLDGMLGYDPALQIQSCEQLQSELERVASGQAPVVGADTPRHGTGFDAMTNTPRAPYPAASPLPFAKLGHFQIVARLGSGGMGDVYQGFDPQLERTVALKVLPPELARQSDFVRRFVDEAKAAARLVHPNIVQIYFIGEDQGHHYFAMQYVAGETLAARLSRENKLTLDDSLAIMEQVLSGLSVAHHRGMIHRDIKPGNILLDFDHDRVLLADFGLVKSLDSTEQMTATGMVMGTVDYISPEQGRGHKIDTRSDLYSIGVLLFQMLSGQLPFVAESATALIFQHAYEKPRLLEDVVPNIPAGASVIVRRLLAKSPSDRYQTAEDLLADVRALHASHDWQPKPFTADAEPRRTAVIEAIDFDSEEERRVTEALAPLPRARWQDRLRVLFHLHAPVLLKNLQNTEHQVDGALAIYQDRRDKLARLAHEAAAVELLLSEQGLETEFRQQQAEREEIEFRLAKADATLQKLRSQQALLRARLRAVEAERKLNDADAPQTGLFRPRVVRGAIIGIAIFAVSLFFLYVARPTFFLSGKNKPYPVITAIPDVIVPSTGWVSLTPLIDVEKNAIGEHWKMAADGRIHVMAGRPKAPRFLKIPILIHGSYELQFNYQITWNRTALTVQMPAGNGRIGLAIGAPDNNIAINGVHGWDANNPARDTYDSNFAAATKIDHTAVVRVEPASNGGSHVMLTIDGRPQVDWSGNEPDVEVGDKDGLMLPTEPIILLNTSFDGVNFSQFALRMLDGSATPMREEAAAPNPPRDNIATPSHTLGGFPETISAADGWVNLMPLVDIEKNSMGGSWSLTDGTINRSGPRRISFLKIPLLIHGSYELRFNYRVTRIATGNHSGLSLRLPAGNLPGSLALGNDLNLPSDDEHEAIVRVESPAAGPLRTKLTIDGKEQDGNEPELNSFNDKGYVLPNDPILILGAWGNGNSYRKLALRMLDGSAEPAPGTRTPIEPPGKTKPISQPPSDWINLTSLVDPKRYSVGGNWSVFDGNVHVVPEESQKESTFLRIPQPIQGDYEFRFKYLLASSNSGLSVRMPVGNSRARFEIGRIAKENGIGLNGVQGLAANDTKNPTYDANFANPINVEREALIRVTRTSTGESQIAVTIDGKKQIDWRGNESDLHLVQSEFESRLSNDPVLFLGAHGDGVTLKQLEMQQLDEP